MLIMLKKTKQTSLGLFLGISGSSSLILSILIWLIYFKTPSVHNFSWVSSLPALNALLNSISFLLLLSGLVLIKKGHVRGHVRCMLAAAGISVLFVISYALYHFLHGETKFFGQGNIRYFYFAILISHIMLSFPLVPLVLTTLWHGLKGNHKQHRIVARITFPIWLYISVTGVLIFLILNNFNQV